MSFDETSGIPIHDVESERRETLLDRIRSLRALDIEVALRAALAAGVPLLVLVLIDGLEWAPYAAFGGMAAIYGRSEPYRIRLRTVTVAALCLLFSVALGIVLAVTSAPLWVTALVLAGLLAVTITAANAAGASPATPTFFVFALLVCAAAPTPAGEVGVRMLVAALSAIFAWLLSMSGWVLRRIVGHRAPAMFKPLPKDTGVRPRIITDPALWLNIGQNIVGSAAAGVIALAAGIGHPYWAVVSAVATTPPAGAAHSIARALHRTVGTAIGVVVTGLILFAQPPLLVLVLVVVVAQFWTEVFVGRHYGTAMVFVTPLALVVAWLANPVPVQSLLVDRVVETAIGAAVGLVLVLIARAISQGNSSRRIVRR